jgi:hypothetical protein
MAGMERPATSPPRSRTASRNRPSRRISWYSCLNRLGRYVSRDRGPGRHRARRTPEAAAVAELVEPAAEPVSTEARTSTPAVISGCGLGSAGSTRAHAPVRVTVSKKSHATRASAWERRKLVRTGSPAPGRPAPDGDPPGLISSQFAWERRDSEPAAASGLPGELHPRVGAGERHHVPDVALHGAPAQPHPTRDGLVGDTRHEQREQPAVGLGQRVGVDDPVAASIPPEALTFSGTAVSQ